MKPIEQLGASPAPWKAEMKDGPKAVSTKSGVSIYPVLEPRKGKTRDDLLREAKADARLIAAAPDLYKALRLALTEMGYVSSVLQLRHNGYDFPDEVVRLLDAQIEARKALRKAGGMK